MKRRDVLKALAGLFAAPAIVAKAEPPKETCVCCGREVAELLDARGLTLNRCQGCGGLFCVMEHGCYRYREEPTLNDVRFLGNLCDACYDGPEQPDEDEEDSSSSSPRGSSW